MPDKLAGAPFRFSGTTAADVADAEHAIVALDARAVALADTEALARLFLRAEAVASSNIEGLVASPQRIVRFDLARDEGVIAGDATAREILANIEAMRFALADDDAPITPARLNQLHALLLSETRAARFAGVPRTDQNWIGGPSRFTPYRAAYIPPPPEFVPKLLADLCVFANDDRLSPVAQAAIAHARFETIHPYADGNGRTGRALTYMILRRRGLARRCIPPLSLVLAAESDAYVAALQATRVDAGEGANAALERWISFIAVAIRTAVRDAERFETTVEGIVRSWNDRLADLRRDASARVLVAALPATPILTARVAERLTNTTFAAANNALAELVRRGILDRRGGVRNRTLEATELIDAFTLFERSLASSGRDTRAEPPQRPVPRRPER